MCGQYTCRHTDAWLRIYEGQNDSSLHFRTDWQSLMYTEGGICSTSVTRQASESGAEV